MADPLLAGVPVNGRGFAALGALSIGWAVDVAYACPSCASPLEENRQAFVDTTIFMTVVPLAMVGGMIWWIRRKAKELEKPPEIQVPDNLLRDVGSFTKDR
jgi:amino acid transporter